MKKSSKMEGTFLHLQGQSIKYSTKLKQRQNQKKMTVKFLKRKHEKNRKLKQSTLSKLIRKI
jgi:glutamine amidotransferase-like uncharacterized protein